MKTFQEWVEAKHPEIIDEDWRKWARNAMLATTLVPAGLGIGCSGGQCKVPQPEPQRQSQEMTPQQKLDAAQKRAAQWKKNFTKKQVDREIKKYGEPKLQRLGVQGGGVTSSDADEFIQ